MAAWRQELGEVGGELPERFYRRLGRAERTGGNIASANGWSEKQSELD